MHYACTFNLTLFGSSFSFSKADFPFPFPFPFLSHHSSLPYLEAIYVSIWMCCIVSCQNYQRKRRKQKHFRVRETHTHVISHVGRIAAHGRETFLSKSQDWWTFFRFLNQVRKKLTLSEPFLPSFKLLAWLVTPYMYTDVLFCGTTNQLHLSSIIHLSSSPFSLKPIPSLWPLNFQLHSQLWLHYWEVIVAFFIA